MSSEWSQWLDFDSATVDTVPESPGVCVMHANMKVLYIGAGQNIKQELRDKLLNDCTSKAKRFRYILAHDFETVKKQQVQEYVDKHGKAPPCMEQNAL